MRDNDAHEGNLYINHGPGRPCGRIPHVTRNMLLTLGFWPLLDSTRRVLSALHEVDQGTPNVLAEQYIHTSSNGIYASREIGKWDGQHAARVPYEVIIRRQRQCV